MKTRVLAFAITLMMTLTGAPASGQTAGRAKNGTPSATTNQQGAVQVAAGTTAVTGSGTAGKITKWVGNTTSSFVVGDSSITEDKFGNVGIGTGLPTSKLTVQGTIESLAGGFKFPDGTVQTTAGMGSIVRNSTLAGNGTNGSPLGVAVPLGLAGAALNGDAILRVNNLGVGGLGIKVEAQDGIRVTGLGGIGLESISNIGIAVKAKSDYGPALDATSLNIGISAFGGSIYGVATVSDTGNGITALSNSGLAGEFLGDVEVVGNLSKGGGSFKIDHPLDPENKYLYHSFVESPDMKNIYDGVATLDEKGEAVVKLPDYFESLNRDFRYLLTAIGAPGPGIYIAEKVSTSQFKIAGGAPGMEVSWQVTGIRQDAFANKNRIQVEVNKAEKERGYYLHPGAFGKSEEKGVEWARNPELMRQVKETRTAARQKTGDR